VKDIYRRKHETKDERIQRSRKENGSKHRYSEINLVLHQERFGGKMSIKEEEKYESRESKEANK
jgi:hypothetical protein